MARNVILLSVLGLVLCMAIPAQATLGLNVRLSPYGAPGVQLVGRAGHIGTNIGFGFDSLQYQYPEQLAGIMRHLPFDAGMRYYIFNSHDEIYVFLNLGSQIGPTAYDMSGDLLYVASRMMLASGAGLQTLMWNHLLISLSVGVSYGFAPFIVTGDASYEPPFSPLGIRFYFDAAIGALVFSEPAR